MSTCLLFVVSFLWNSDSQDILLSQNINWSINCCTVWDQILSCYGNNIYGCIPLSYFSEHATQNLFILEHTKYQRLKFCWIRDVLEDWHFWNEKYPASKANYEIKSSSKVHNFLHWQEMSCKLEVKKINWNKWNTVLIGNLLLGF